MKEMPSLLILSKPQISVDVNDDGEVIISVASIAEKFDSVDIHEVRIPRECAKEVGQALLAIAKMK